jgi:hypothetical protein
MDLRVPEEAPGEVHVPRIEALSVESSFRLRGEIFASAEDEGRLPEDVLSKMEGEHRPSLEALDVFQRDELRLP